MFDLKGSKEIYNKGNIKQIIIDKDSITISFEEGYEDKDGNFVLCGSLVAGGGNSLCDDAGIQYILTAVGYLQLSFFGISRYTKICLDQTFFTDKRYCLSFANLIRNSHS